MEATIVTNFSLLTEKTERNEQKKLIQQYFSFITLLLYFAFDMKKEMKKYIFITYIMDWCLKSSSLFFQVSTLSILPRRGQWLPNVSQ